MKLKMEPLLGAVAFGVVVLVVGGLISLMLSYQAMQDMLNIPILDPNFIAGNGSTTAAQEAQFQQTFNYFDVMSGMGSMLSCLTRIIAGVGAGFLYPVLHKRYGVLESGAVSGGAAAGTLASVIGYLFTSIVSALLFIPIMNEWMNQAVMATEQTISSPPNFGLFWVTAFIIGTVCGTLFIAMIGAVLGAIGGVIGGALTK